MKQHAVPHPPPQAGPFPPRTAGASLKHRAQPAVPGVEQLLSPANCGGLIEARSRPEHWRPRPPFPPRTAGASLKRVRVGLAAVPALGAFPPRTAGASLKHGLMAGGRWRSTCLSPANCGGLIEAFRDRDAAAVALALSPANCGGLIEAGSSANSAAARRTLSPANCGGLIEAAVPAHSFVAPPAPFPRELRGPH